MLLCLTANHLDTDFDVLDRVSRAVDATEASTIASAPMVNGAVVVSTCNRFEVYLDVDDRAAPTPDLAGRVLRSLPEADAREIARAAVVLTGDEAVRHLFGVVAGAKSMVLGEGEISGQVQRALGTARSLQATTPELEQTFQRAASASRAVRARVDLAASGRTVVRTALDMLSERIPDWADKRVLIVGTGSYAATTVASLRARGAADLRVFSATGRAELFAQKYGMRAQRELRDAVADADVVITCTSRYTVLPDDIRDAAPRIVVDLGLPRNVAPEVGDLPGIELIDLEVIGRYAALPELAADIHRLVGVYADAYISERAAGPTVVAWRQWVQHFLQREVDRLGSRAADDRTASALRHFAGMLAHVPSVRAREYAAAGRLDEFQQALLTVFGPEFTEVHADTLADVGGAS